MKRFLRHWFIQLQPSRVSEDEAVRRAKDFINKVAEEANLTSNQHSQLLSNVDWLDYFIKDRRQPFAIRWWQSTRSWFVYFGIQIREEMFARRLYKELE